MRDLSVLENLVAEDRGLEARMAELAATAARDLAEGASLPLLQQGLRQAWSEQHLRAAARRRRELATAIHAARAAAVQSLGRHRALDDLVERADRAELATRQARAEREAPPTPGRART